MKTKAFNYAFLAFLIVSIATGMMLHVDVNHKHIVGFTPLTYIHLAAVAAMLWMTFQHVRKHSKWFGAFAKLRWSKKTINGLMAVVGTTVAVSGVLILFSAAHELSIAHYITGILFTLLALGHSVKRIARTLKKSIKAMSAI